MMTASWQEGVQEAPKLELKRGKFNDPSTPTLLSMVPLNSRQSKEGQAIYWLEGFLSKMCVVHNRLES